MYVHCPQGKPPSTSSVTVTVAFLPASSSGFPAFTSAPQSTLQILENTTIGTVVAVFAAVSPKTGASISYLVVGGNIEFSFTIDGQGQLKVNTSLDYLKAATYSLWIAASDNGSPPLSAFINVIVNIINCNDNAPDFTLLSYSVGVLEEQAPPVAVLTVTATDPDLGENGRVTYQLVPRTGDGNGAFKIDATTGIIQTVVKLDREKSSKYQLVVLAMDHVS